MDAPRAAMGQGWPFAACPWNSDGAKRVTNPKRSAGPDAGASPFGSYWRGRPSGRLPKGTRPAGRNQCQKQLGNDPSK